MSPLLQGLQSCPKVPAQHLRLQRGPPAAAFLPTPQHSAA
ncbi:hypothetical protein E2C01_100660 [Portunus trituberculatus]|uniref:Uncharacterized protein n=1 Tax=Portunus trituberculatus TaxID=210409 RepID=A0A5B7KDL2_PORTR|nr:hypothetical protein [Portunus trituberculatus]